MEIREFKSAAKLASEYLGRDGVEVSQAKMLETLSRAFGARNWVSFRETLRTRGLDTEPAAEAPLTQVTQTILALVEAMEMQEKRMSGEFHLTAAAASFIWDGAKAKGKELVAYLRDIETHCPALSNQDASNKQQAAPTAQPDSAPLQISQWPEATHVRGQYKVEWANGSTWSVPAVLDLRDAQVHLVLSNEELGQLPDGPYEFEAFEIEDPDGDEFPFKTTADSQGRRFIDAGNTVFTKRLMKG